MKLQCRRCMRQAPLAEWRALRRHAMIPVADGSGYATVYEHRNCNERVVVITKRAGQPVAVRV